jgi:hypothetical protein
MIISGERGVPRYLIWFAVPPYLAALVIAAIDPMAGLALLASLMIMVVVPTIVLRWMR